MKNLKYLFLLLSCVSINSLLAQYSISGQITCYGSGNGMTNQEVKLSGSNMADIIVNTDANGNYTFLNVPAGDDYVLTVERDDVPLNGVSTFDLVVTMNHILGINPFTSPFQFLAVDVNNSGTITTFDLIIIRKLILFIDPDFPNVPSWRFATSDFDPATSSGSVGGATILNLQADQVIDFVGVKMGDVNGSAVCP